MVFPDFSFSKPASENAPLRVAPVFDRLLAFFIDLLIFSPVVALANSFVLREVRLSAWANPDASEAAVMYFSLVAGSVLLAVLVESLFLVRRGATPGQSVMKIRVRSWPERGELTFTQCLTRTVMWWVSWPLVLPLTGVYTGRFRRAFHESASNTVTSTLKEAGDPGPAPAEARFVQTWSQIAFLFVLFAGAASLTEVYRLSRSGHFAVMAAADAELCGEVGRELTGPGRLDRAMAGFLTGAFDADCLEREADFALWHRTAPKDLASLAKSLSFEDPDLAKSYAGLACEASERGEACAVARAFAADESERGDILRESGLRLVTSRVLLLKDDVDRKALAASADLLKTLREEEMLAAWLDRQEVRLFWKLREAGGGHGGKNRQPASAEDDKLLQDFLERHDLR